MFFNAITFKDSATPFAEALVELHHEIMFYLVVIVSVVIFILINAINITRVRESYFYSNIFSTTSFIKALFLNSIFSPVFNKFLYSSYYSRFYSYLTNLLVDFTYLVITKGSSYINYFLKSILLTKNFSLRFLSLFSKIESFLSRVLGDYRNLGPKNLFPNAFSSNSYFYKTRSSTAYFTYLSHIISYLSIVSIFSDIDYKNYYKNKELLFSHFNNLIKSSTYAQSSRAITNNLNLESLEKIYFNNDIPAFAELNPHFSVFFVTFLKNKFTFGNSLRTTSSNKLANITTSTSRSIYSFINAQAYTVHNTKLEII